MTKVNYGSIQITTTTSEKPKKKREEDNNEEGPSGRCSRLYTPLRNKEARTAGHACPQSQAAIGQGGQCRLPPNKRKEEES